MKKKKRKFRVVTFLKRDELDFLDEMLKDLYFQYGIKVPRSQLLEELITSFEAMARENKKEIEEDVMRRFKEAEGNFKKQLGE